MQVPSTQDLLAAWEHGRAEPRPSGRALALLSAACTDMGADEIARLTIGARDRLLLTLRREMFGSRLAAVTSCPACQTSLEMEFDVNEISVVPPAGAQWRECADSLSLSHDGYAVSFRLPNSLDLLALPGHGSVEEGKRHLIARLLQRALHGGREISAAELPPALIDALDQQMSLADPQGDIRLNLSCAECDANWRAPFDIVSYLWSETDAWAIRALRDVHRLAQAYGWSEADILALSPMRRQCYLDMLDA